MVRFVMITLVRSSALIFVRAVVAVHDLDLVEIKIRMPPHLCYKSANLFEGFYILFFPLRSLFQTDGAGQDACISDLLSNVFPQA